MLFKFTVILALCLIVLLKVDACSHFEEDVIVGNKVDDLLKKLEAAVDKAVVQAQKALDDAKAQLAAYASKYEVDADAQMANDEKSWLDQLDKLKAQAKEKSIVITECLGENESKLDNMQTTYHNNMVGCVNGNIEAGTKYAQGALDKIKSLVSEIENIKQEIKNCGGGIKGAKCLAKLAIKVEQDITNLPAQVETAAAETALAIAKLQPKVKSCAEDAASSCRTSGQSVFSVISTCISGKINH